MDKILPYRFRRWLRLTRRGAWVYVVLMPWFVPLTAYLFVGAAYWQTAQNFIEATLLSWLLSTGSFLTHDWVGNLIARRYPELRQTMVRAGLLLLTFIGLSGIFLTIFSLYFIHFHPFGSNLTYSDLLTIYTVNLVILLLLVGIYETAYSMYRWQQYQMNKEKLKKENLRGQLQGLRSQVSPHFLFNSLNSLSSLIAEEPQRAEQFVDQMARVYRYMLQANRHTGATTQATVSVGAPTPGQLFTTQTLDESDELTTLDDELAFIESYFHLLKTRHGDGLHLNVQVADQYRQRRLPPLTLQLLVENAVKHNVILATRPLSIDILVNDNGNLLVRNNLQKKNSRSTTVNVESMQVGLTNIQAKYQLLESPEPLIETGPDYFTVTLPLLAKT